MTDHDTLERIARQLCESAGRDYDRKGAKRAYWRGKARRVLSDFEKYPSLLWLAWSRAKRASGWFA
jgi:hypothetical protein